MIPHRLVRRLQKEISIVSSTRRGLHRDAIASIVTFRITSISWTFHFFASCTVPSRFTITVPWLSVAGSSVWALSANRSGAVCRVRIVRPRYVSWTRSQRAVTSRPSIKTFTFFIFQFTKTMTWASWATEGPLCWLHEEKDQDQHFLNLSVERNGEKKKALLFG